MSGYTFTRSTEADAELVARYQARLARLAPACSRCGHKLAKGELAARVCRDRELCRIRRAGGTVAGFASLRKFANRDKPAAVKPAPVRKPEPAVAAAERGGHAQWVEKVTPAL